MKGVRTAILAIVMLFGVAALGGCHDHSSSHHAPAHDVAFTVHNHHDAPVWIQGIDAHGHGVDLGTVYVHERVDFILSDYWVGRTLRARCDVDNEVLDVEFAYEGLHWDVY